MRILFSFRIKYPASWGICHCEKAKPTKQSSDRKQNFWIAAPLSAARNDGIPGCLRWGGLFAVLALIMLSLPLASYAEEKQQWAITTDAAASRLRDLDIVGVNLSMSIKEIIEVMEARRYSSSCGNSSCSFRKNNGAYNVKIVFPRMGDHKYRPDEIHYSSMSSTMVCRKILKNVCGGTLSASPCRTHHDIIFASIKQKVPDSEGWRYELGVELNNGQKSCILRAAQNWTDPSK